MTSRRRGDGDGGASAPPRSETAAEPLRRLGGGRWATRDGRFTIEPQGGTWVVVDAEQTDELGLPRVRGPFGSLGDAREAVAAAQDSSPESSPLAARLEAVGPAAAATPDAAAAASSGRATGRRATGRGGPERTTRPERAHAAEPPPPRRPAWLEALPPKLQGSALALIADLERAGLPRPEALVRAEIEDDRPAIAEALLARRLSRVVAELGAGAHAADAIRAVIRVLDDGGDPTSLRLSGWRLVDDRERRIRLDADDIA